MSAQLVAALDSVWTSVRKSHPDVPQAFLVVASGATDRKRLKLGHFVASRWQAKSAADDDSDDKAAIAEVLIGGEGLRRSAEEVLTTLLHEAAHGVAFTRKIQDTSRQGRYHNEKFAALARELGIEVTKDDTLGWSPSTLLAATAKRYEEELAKLRAGLVVFRRHAEPSKGRGQRTSSNNPLPCVCSCGRQIRVSEQTLGEGPIVCGICDDEFTPKDAGEA